MSMAGVPLKGQEILTFNGPDLGKGGHEGQSALTCSAGSAPYGSTTPIRR
jgi:hypothetical protein